MRVAGSQDAIGHGRRDSTIATSKRARRATTRQPRTAGRSATFRAQVLLFLDKKMCFLKKNLVFFSHFHLLFLF